MEYVLTDLCSWRNLPACLSRSEGKTLYQRSSSRLPGRVLSPIVTTRVCRLSIVNVILVTYLDDESVLFAAVDCDPGILCVTHCGPRVFCLQLPEHCPVCRTSLGDHHPPLIPFRVPYPFVRAHQHHCAVVIKPSNGDFLNDYKVSSDLHIGVTDSGGRVVEYDQHGLRRDRRQFWPQCLVVSQLCDEAWTERWDQTLASVAKQDCWTPNRYHEETFNCYTFVLSFLRCLRDGTLSEAAASKVQFCEAFVSPRATTACKYIALYRRLKDSGYYVSRTQPRS